MVSVALSGLLLCICSCPGSFLLALGVWSYASFHGRVRERGQRAGLGTQCSSIPGSLQEAASADVLGTRGWPGSIKSKRLAGARLRQQPVSARAEPLLGHTNHLYPLVRNTPPTP